MQPRGTTITSLWADLLVEQLVRCGIDCFSLSPGSRSTPLVAAIAHRSDATKLVHVDERGAAFFATGYARATGRPAAWITTSGTAAANGLPAVVEASKSTVPLLIITADRPPELRDTGANQTIDQVKLYGDYVRWQFDLPVPDPQIDPRMVLTTAAQAVYRAVRQPQGPVHLNAMFREPLEPADDGHDYTAYLAPVAAWLASDTPFSQSVPPRSEMPSQQSELVAHVLNQAQRGLVVLGELRDERQRTAALELAARLNWPLLPDISSGARLGLASPQVIPYYDQVLAGERLAGELQPDAVLHIGGSFVSKRLLQFLGRSQPQTYILLKEHPFRHDPNHQVMLSVEADIAGSCERIVQMVERSGAQAWLERWRHASACVGEHIDRFLSAHSGINEPQVARTLSRYIPDGHALFLGNSMPIRDMDMYAATDGANIPVGVNRGASGIDGNVATAAGFAHGLQRPATLLLGDLALLHDLNSLALVRSLPIPLTVVVVNNNGGGIFSFLPIAQHTDIFEPFFGTPHNVSFEHAANMFDLNYARPASMADFETVYRTATTGTQATLIEVVTDRQENYALHAALREQIVAELERR